MLYSPVHISWNEVFSKILKKPSIVQKRMIPHMKAFSLFIDKKQNKIFEKPNNQKQNVIFQLHQFSKMA